MTICNLSFLHYIILPDQAIFPFYNSLNVMYSSARTPLPTSPHTPIALAGLVFPRHFPPSADMSLPVCLLSLPNIYQLNYGACDVKKHIAVASYQQYKIIFMA
jgi:hypothetical protein